MGKGRHVRPTPRRRRARSSNRRNGRVSVVVGTIVGVAAVAAVAVATHTSDGPWIDLTSDDAVIQHDGAVFLQGPLPAGTGQFDPFLTLQSNQPTERGHNTDAAGGGANTTYNSFFGGDRTHPLNVAAVPVLDFVDPYPEDADGDASGRYREFVLDANDSGNDKCMSIDEIRIFVDEQTNLKGYDPVAHDFNNDVDELADEIFLVDQPILMKSQRTGQPACGGAGSGESGSGVGDITVLIPEDVFPENCDYGNPDCDQWLYFWTEKGGANQNTAINGETRISEWDWDVSAGFEEWRTRLLPVVSVDKTVDESATVEYGWTIEKSVDPDEHHLFDGDSDTSSYTVSVTKTLETVSATISGTITILNPTGDGQIISEPIPAEITDVSDYLDLGGGPGDIDVDCGVEISVASPYTLGAGEELVCTYEYEPSSLDSGSNVGSATINTEFGPVTYADTESVSFDPGDITELNDTVDVTDAFDGGVDTLIDSVSTSTSFPAYERTFDCSDVTFAGGATTSDTVTYNNTAKVKSGTTILDEDSESVDVTCYRPSVSKDASTAYTLTYGWTIEKSVDPAEHHLFDGDSDTSSYTVSVTKDSGTESGWAISGNISVTNPHPTDTMTINLSDTLDDATSVTIGTCSGDGVSGTAAALTVGPGSTATCPYSASPTGKTATTNTASFGLFGKTYTDTASVDWGTATVTKVNDSVDVTDQFEGGAIETISTSVSSSTTFPSYGRPFDCSDVTFAGGATTSDTVTYNNTARVLSGTTVLDDDSESVDVTCYRPTISKDADTSFDRDYDWDIVKTRFIADGEDDGDGDPLTLTMAEGETVSANYRVTMTMTGYTDSNYGVDGSIVVTNTHPTDTMTVALSDVLTGTDASAVTIGVCSGAGVSGTAASLSVAAGSTATCSYSASPSGTDVTMNTASFGLFGKTYSDTASVDFGTATISEIDECVTITDDNGTPGNTSDDFQVGQVCANELDSNDQAEFEYTIDIGPFEVCGEYTFTNTASFETDDDENDTTESGSDTYTVTIDIPCPDEGCTPGFWKNHTDLWVGYSPTDTIGAVFAIPSELSDLANDTLLEALDYPGGNDEIGAARILLRAAVAALLNASDGDVAYPYGEQQVIDMTDTALASLDRQTMLGLAGDFDFANNAGCPIDSFGEPIVDTTSVAITQEAGSWTLAWAALVASMMASVARRGRHGRGSLLTD